MNVCKKCKCLSPQCQCRRCKEIRSFFNKKFKKIYKKHKSKLDSDFKNKLTSNPDGAYFELFLLEKFQQKTIDKEKDFPDCRLTTGEHIEATIVTQGEGNTKISDYPEEEGMFSLDDMDEEIIVRVRNSINSKYKDIKREITLDPKNGNKIFIIALNLYPIKKFIGGDKMSIVAKALYGIRNLYALIDAQSLKIVKKGRKLQEKVNSPNRKNLSSKGFLTNEFEYISGILVTYEDPKSELESIKNKMHLYVNPRAKNPLNRENFKDEIVYFVEDGVLKNTGN